MRARTSLAFAPAAITIFAAALGGCAASGGSDAVPPRTAAPTAAASLEALPSPPAERLRGEATPLAMDLELTVDPAARGFSGTARLRIRLEKPQRYIDLHGKGLDVHKITVTPDGGAPVAGTWQSVSESGVARITFPRELAPGAMTVAIDYSAPWGQLDSGLYLAPQAGVPYAFTQFEAIRARLAFPCFDEPAYKVPHRLALRVPRGAKAIANTPQVRRTRIDETMDRVEFAETLPIPVYLLAFAVGDFDIVEAKAIAPNAVRSAPVPLRGVAPRGRGKEMAYMLGRAGAYVAELEAYTGIPYPYGKLDLIAVPGKGGAMENPGAITFLETELLVDEGARTATELSFHNHILAHELAHQWFGNLVTARYWDDIWLNEAFATWAQMRVQERVQPDAHSRSDAFSSGQRVIDMEGFGRVRRIREPIVHAGDIELAFDDVTYAKGGAVLGMVEQWVGVDAFQKAVRSYLKAHAHGAATADDFYAAVAAAGPRGSEGVATLRAFVERAGAPRITVSTTCTGGKGGVVVRQVRFAGPGAGEPKAEANAHAPWAVPVCGIADVKGRIQPWCTFLDKPEATVPLEGCAAWALPGRDAVGYYAYSVDSDTSARIVKALPRMTAPDKLAYAEALRRGYLEGRVSPAAGLQSTRALAKEDDDSTLAAAAAPLMHATRWFASDDDRAALAREVRAVFGRPLPELGLVPGGAQGNLAARRARAFTVKLLASRGLDPDVRRALIPYGESVLQGNGAGGLARGDGPGDVRSIAVAVAVDASTETAQRALALWPKLTTDMDRRVVREALLDARSPEIAAALRARALDTTHSARERMHIVARGIDDPTFRAQTWGWLTEHIDAFEASLPTLYRPAVVGWVIDGLCSREDEARARALFTPRVREEDGSARSLDTTLESIRACAATRELQESALRAHLAGSRPSPRSVTAR